MKKTMGFLCAIVIALGLFLTTSVAGVETEYEMTSDEYEMMDAEYGDETQADGFEEEENFGGPYSMYVSGQPYVRLRKTDSTELPYVDKMPYGTEVTVVGTQVNDIGEEWSLVVYNQQHGFCMTKYLSYEIEATASEMYPQTMQEAFGTSLLQKGNHYPNYRVKNLQLCLITGGFLNDDNGADGYFGSNTYRALCAFQKSQGLEPVGRAGNITKTRLWYLYWELLTSNGMMQ